MLLWQFFTSNCVRFAFSVSLLFFRLEFYDLRKSWLRTSPPPSWEVSFYICDTFDSDALRSFQATSELRSLSGKQTTAYATRVTLGETLLMGIKITFWNIEGRLRWIQFKDNVLDSVSFGDYGISTRVFFGSVEIVGIRFFSCSCDRSYFTRGATPVM